MCTDLKQLINLSAITQPVYVKLLDGSIRSVTQTGDVTLIPRLIMRGVLYTPCFKFNLISVNELSSNAHIKFVFYHTHFLLQELRTEETIAKGKVIDSLYVLDNSSNFARQIGSVLNCNTLNCPDTTRHMNDMFSSNCKNSNISRSMKPNSCDMCLLKCNRTVECLHDISSKPDLHIRNKRLAHALYSLLCHINSSDIPIVLNDDKTNDLKDCEVCHRAKQTRHPFLTLTSNGSSIFKLVHVDIWGPYSQPSPIGASYMITIIDDFSQAVWTYLSQHKSQTSSIFESFINMVQTQFNTKLKNVRTNNSNEFLSINFLTLLTRNGIIHQKNCMYTP